MSILLNIITFILLFSLIQNSKIKGNDFISLIYYEYSYNLSEIKIDIQNPEVSIIESTSCHLAYIKNFTADYNDIFDFYSLYFNRQWIFFSDNAEIINQLLKIDYENKNIYLMGILFPRDLNYSTDDSNDIPIFAIDSNYTQYMKIWDMRNESKNIYFTLKINHAIEFYPENYFLLLSIIVLLSTFSIFIYWKITLKKINPEHILIIHRIALFIIYLNNLLCFLLIVKSIDIRGTKIYGDEKESSILIDIVLITLRTIHRFLLWFFVLLLSFGWNISLQRLNDHNCKFFSRTIISLFIALSFDQILDIEFEPIFKMNISEIKNVFLYLIVIAIMLYQIKKNINFLKMKLYYANMISPEYINSLEFKLKLFYKLRVLLIAYYIVFVTILVLEKTIFYIYDEVIFESYNYLALDCIFMYAFLIIFRPQELPEYYKINFGDILDGEDNGIIYKSELPSYSEAHIKIKDLTKNQIDECIKKNMPIIIVGPNVKNLNKEDYSINKYFLNSSIGFANNSK